MKTNSNIFCALNILGVNLRPESKLSTKIFSLIKNILILFYFIFFAFIPSIYYIEKHFDDRVEVFMGLTQIPCYTSCISSYIFLCAYKSSAFELFQNFESLVRAREKNCEQKIFYAKTIEQANNVVKWPYVVFFVSITINSLTAVFVDIVRDLFKEEIDIGSWSRPFRYE